MGLIRKSEETLDGVQDASRRIVASTEWATVALIAVAALALVGMAVGVAALARTHD